MLEINKSYVTDANQQTVAVQIPIAEFEQIESALEVIADRAVPVDIDVEL